MPLATIYEGTAPGRHPVTYGTSLHKGTAAVAIRVNKMNISPMSIQFTRPTLGHLSAQQIRLEIYDAPPPHPHSRFLLPSFQHEAAYVRKDGKREKKQAPTGREKQTKRERSWLHKQYTASSAPIEPHACTC